MGLKDIVTIMCRHGGFFVDINDIEGDLLPLCISQLFQKAEYFLSEKDKKDDVRNNHDVQNTGVDTAGSFFCLIFCNSFTHGALPQQILHEADKK